MEAIQKQPAEVQTSLTAMRNRCLMLLLERVAERFNEAGVSLMVLKGAALNLIIHERPDERPMADLDILIRHEDIEDARRLLEELGCLRGEPLVREDFFPRFYYETEYVANSVYPLKIDLHVRPFRPMRYAHLMPEDAFWSNSVPICIGGAEVLAPSNEEMLIHLAVHAAVHAYSQEKWLADIVQWLEVKKARIDWETFAKTVAAWGLALPVRQALMRAEVRERGTLPKSVAAQLLRQKVGWRDRLALWHAPRDADHTVRHVAVNLLTAPCSADSLAYLIAVLFPGRAHMSEWYLRRHRGWLATAHLIRCCGPLVRRIPLLWNWISRVETRESRIHGRGVFATGDFAAGRIIAHFRGQPVERRSPYVIRSETHGERLEQFEITGLLRFLNHSCGPNAEITDFALTAIRDIPAGEEITIYYSNGSCDCRPDKTKAAA